MSALSRADLSDSLIKRLAWDDLDLGHLRKLVEHARDEDLAGLGLRHRPRTTGDRSTGSLKTTPRQGSADVAAADESECPGHVSGLL